MADLRWNSVNADFNDANSAMGNSIGGISQAGTVFGELRKSILDEEQRAVDNAYREKEFDENVRQFGLKHALDQDKLFETGRHNKESERLTGRGQDIQRDRLAMDKTTQDTALQDREVRKQVYNQILGTRQEALAAEEAAQANFTGPISPEQQAQNEARLKQLRDQLSATTLDNDVRIEIAKQLGVVDAQTPVTGLATTEQARAVKGTEQSLKTQQAFSDSYSKGSTLITKAIEDADYRQTFGQAYELGVELTKGTGVKPEEVANLLLQNGLRENWLGSGQSPTSELEEFISNPSNTTNPIYQQLMLRAGKASSGLGSSDTSQIPQQQTPDTQPVNLSTLTPEALDYREQQILKGLPTPESLNSDSEQVQARFNQLYRASYGDMPKSEVPTAALKTLEERALQDARNTIQQMRTQATSAIASERSNRARIEAMSSMYGSRGWGYYGS